MTGPPRHADQKGFTSGGIRLDVFGHVKRIPSCFPRHHFPRASCLNFRGLSNPSDFSLFALDLPPTQDANQHQDDITFQLLSRKLT